MKFSEAILWPLSLPYSAIARLRARAYRSGILPTRRLPGTVISVGNLTVGGTGKTPMVLWIAERLLAKGKNVGILTRGYGAQKNSQASVRGNASPQTSTSDEVQLLDNRLVGRARFGIAADRFARGSELAAQGVDWFVLDDGFQHLPLARDVNMVLIDAANPFGGGLLLPAGRLREPRTALARADIIVITRSAASPAIEAGLRRYSSAPIFYAQTRLEAVLPVSSTKPTDARELLAGQNIFAFCGIGNPTAFVSDLRAWGFQVAGKMFFPDHHRYTANDLREIHRAAKACGASGILCTEKDKFNLVAALDHAADISFCRISMEVSKPAELWNEIMSRAGAHRGKNS